METIKQRVVLIFFLLQHIIGFKFELSIKKIFWSTGELLILTVGLYYGNSARNARVQFEERRFLFYAITAELTFSTLYNSIRTVYPIPFHQDVTFIAAFTRSLLTNTLALIIIFAPKVRIHINIKHGDSFIEELITLLEWSHKRISYKMLMYFFASKNVQYLPTYIINFFEFLFVCIKMLQKNIPIQSMKLNIHI